MENGISIQIQSKIGLIYKQIIMENKINIAELLKDCPKGMELDCVMFENVTFEGIKHDEYPIIVKIKEPPMALSLTKTGGWNLYNSAKCVIYPKGKTTWEGFQRPFEDGDIVAYDGPYRDYLQIFIFKDKKENNTLSDCYLMLDVEDDELYLEDGMYYVTRFATEEEKKKLFQAIKNNGYKWNPETKTLERLVESSEEEQVGMNELGMMWQKQALIKKACEWLENIDFASEYFYDGEGFFDNAILVEEFKKAMEE